MSTSSGEQERLFAVRGAVQADANEPEAIAGATTELMRELLDRNELAPEAMVSCLFTTTDDLDAEFPAVAARSRECQLALPAAGNHLLDHHVPGEQERARLGVPREQRRAHLVARLVLR